MISEVICLGPEGSYSNLAIKIFEKYFESHYRINYCSSIYEAMQFLKESDSNILGAVLPIENSIEGIVRETQDNLVEIAQYNYRIFAETVLDIRHVLVGYGSKNDIKTITSHSQALAQCRDYIYKNWGNEVVLIPTLSTSHAINSLFSNDLTVAAIGSEFCANLYGVPIIETSINDEQNNTTRFILICKNKPFKSEKNKISINFSTDNKPGALNKVLNVFENYNINLSYIDSRPSRKQLGEYIFFLDCEGYITDDNIASAITDIQNYITTFEVLSEGAIYI